MGIAAQAIEKRALTYFASLLVFVAGTVSFFSLGQLEDPEFTIKTAIVATPYPGASPEEVELEVTDRLELAIQQIKSLDQVRSYSRAGLSVIWVDIKLTYRAHEMPAIWDELRRKLADAAHLLPPGAGTPLVNDDFSDVFGHLVAITGDGFSYREIEGYAKELKKELTLVEGVAKVELWGVQDEVIYIEASETALSQLGIGAATIQGALRNKEVVVDAGSIDVQTNRFRIAPSGQFGSTEDIANLILRAPASDRDRREPGVARGPANDLIRIRDIGEVKRSYAEPARTLMRFDGRDGIAIAISNVPGTNVVDTGRRVAQRLDELSAALPVGIELQRVHWQSEVIASAVDTFLVSFVQALVIVLVVLTIGMGWRLSLIIGFALVGTILASFTLMAVFGIDLQRMSLGALIISLGMMADNAIVVADGYLVRLKQGVDRRRAAIEAAEMPALPLLGATLVAVMAFYPISGSPEDVGEYCASLFSVVAIALLFSWVVSLTLTPLQCMDLLPALAAGDAGGDPHGGRTLAIFRGMVKRAIAVRWLTAGAAVGLLVLSVVAFGQVKQLFFPDSTMPKFMIDYWAPEGTRIGVTSADLEVIEQKLLGDARVAGVATFVGAGPPRFYLPVEPEPPNPAYGQVIVNVHDFRVIDALAAELGPWFAERFPDAQIPVRKYGLGPSSTWKFEVRISGPAVADPNVLRATAAEVMALLRDNPLADVRRTDWRQRVQKIVPAYSEQRAQWAGITRRDIANATKRAFDGRMVGLYREADKLIPVVLRNEERDRVNAGALEAVQVQPAARVHTVPLAQVTDNVLTAWEDPLIWRYDRRRTIKAQASVAPGVTLPELYASTREAIAALELPPGYTLEWGGEYESSRDAQLSLIPGVVPAMIVMAVIVVGLFNAYRPPLVIALTIPFALVGITAGLLGSGVAFGFVALLGAMSLAGMMIKNAVVLLDEVGLNLTRGQTRYDAIVNAAVSRARPVVLASGTTVLGVAPLLQDAMWVGLAVTIMAGLTFGTVLTLLVLPALYAAVYRIEAPVAVGQAAAKLALGSAEG